MKFDWRESLWFCGAGTSGIIIAACCISIANAIDEPVKPTYVPAQSPCYVSFKICQSQLVTKIAPDYVYVLYSAINRVSKAIDSPKGCVKISSNTGRSVYVIGSEQNVLDDIEKARSKCR